MSRVKGGWKTKRRHKGILLAVRGQRGGRSRLWRTAVEAYHHSLTNAYRDRRLRKRDFRSLWIARINAAARQNGMKYSELIHLLKTANIDMDRKVLAQLAIDDPQGFARIIATANQQAVR